MKNQKLANVIVVFFCAFIACYYGFHNKFPLIYPDTGTYVHSGFTGIVPLDRPIIYGFFLRYVSLGVSPWLVILAQGLIASWLLFKTIGLVVIGQKRNMLLVATTILLIFTTGYSFNTSILLPDVFCAFAILGVVHLLFNNQLGKIEHIGLIVLVTFSTSSHLSNLPILGLLLLLLAGLKALKKDNFPASWKNLLISGLAVGIAAPVVSLVNVSYGSSAKISSASHVFLINHFIESGILKPYLDEACETNNYTLCDCKENLSWNFIWSEESCLYDGGGWIETRDEYNEIISDLITSPANWPILIRKGVEYGVKQFFSFNTTLAPPQLGGTSAFAHVSQRFPDAVREYISSKQNQNKLSLATINVLEEWTILLSLGFLVVILLYSEQFGITTELKWVIITVLLFSIIGSFVSANLSTVEPRYQNRIVWIFPVLAIMSLASARHFLKTKNED